MSSDISLLMKVTTTHILQDKDKKYTNAINSTAELIELEKKKIKTLEKLHIALELKRIKVHDESADTAYLMTYSERVIPDSADKKYEWKQRRQWTTDRREVLEKEQRKHKYRNFKVNTYKLPEEA